MSEEKFEFSGSVDVSFVKQKVEDEKMKEQGKDLFWKPFPGNNTIRIFPYKHGKTPFTETFIHYLNDKKGGILCQKFTHGVDECPICDFVKGLYSSGLEEDKKKANDYKAKQRIFLPMINRDEIAKGIEPKLRFWEIPKAVYDSIIKFCLMEDYGDIADANTGNDLIVTFQEKSPSLPWGKIDVMPRPGKTKLLENMELAKKLYEDCPDVFSFSKLKKLSVAEMIERLEGLKNLTDEPKNDSDVEKSNNSEKSDFQAKIDKMIEG